MENVQNKSKELLRMFYRLTTHSDYSLIELY